MSTASDPLIPAAALSRLCAVLTPGPMGMVARALLEQREFATLQEWVDSGMLRQQPDLARSIAWSGLRELRDPEDGALTRLVEGALDAATAHDPSLISSLFCQALYDAPAAAVFLLRARGGQYSMPPTLRVKEAGFDLHTPALAAILLLRGEEAVSRALLAPPATTLERVGTIEPDAMVSFHLRRAVNLVDLAVAMAGSEEAPPFASGTTLPPLARLAPLLAFDAPPVRTVFRDALRSELDRLRFRERRVLRKILVAASHAQLDKEMGQLQYPLNEGRVTGQGNLLHVLCAAPASPETTLAITNVLQQFPAWARMTMDTKGVAAPPVPLTPLAAAALNGNLPAVQALIGHGVRVGSQRDELLAQTTPDVRAWLAAKLAQEAVDDTLGAARPSCAAGV